LARGGIAAVRVYNVWTWKQALERMRAYRSEYWRDKNVKRKTTEEEFEAEVSTETDAPLVE
jgi:hypothetical protein